MPAEVAPEEDSPRSMWRLIFDRTFGLFFFGKMLSTSGMWINNIVCAMVAFELTRSAFMVGLVSVAQFLPQTLLAPLSGALADRGARRYQLILGRLIAASGSGGLAIWIGVAGPEGMPNVAPVLAAALIVGVGLTVGSPAMHSLIPSLVKPNELPPAMALNSVPFILGRAAGPAIGAIVAATGGPHYAFAIASLCNIGFVILLLPIKVGGRHTKEDDSDVDTSVRAGLRYVYQHRLVIFTLLGVVAISFGSDPVLTLTPALSAAVGEEGYAVGVIVSSFGIGAAVAFPTIRPLQRRLGIPTTSVLSLALIAGGNVFAAVSWSLPTVCASFAVSGFGMAIALPSFSTQLQLLVPDIYRGRVMALWIVALQGTRPSAALISGSIADATSESVALFVIATLVLVVAYVCWRATRRAVSDDQAPT